MCKQFRLILFISAFVLFFLTVYGQNAQNVAFNIEHQFFIENKGQWDPEVKFLCRINGMNAWITDNGMTYDFYRITRNKNIEEPGRRSLKNREGQDTDQIRITGHVVRALLHGVNKQTNTVAKGQYDGYFNYFIGSDPASWTSFVGLYNEIEVQSVYTGIDIRYYFDRNQLRYDYQVAAGADLSHIRFQLEGADGYEFNAEGELLIKTSLGEVWHGKLRAYQQSNGKEQEVTCRFESLSNEMIGVKAVNYDKEKPLIIDPLVYSTFIGGSGIDVGNSIAIDNSGNAYITGNTPSTNYPTTSGAYDVSQNGNMDVFVTKLDVSGSTLIFSTFIGGSALDNGNSLTVDSNGNSFITGYTGSTNYPTTSGAYDQSTNGVAYDAFVTKLNVSGSALVYSTFLGGSSTDKGSCIAIDSFGNAFIAGETFSSDFPTTSNGYDKTFNGNEDVFVTKLNSSGSALTYSTYLGGTSYDIVHGLAVDVNGYACVTGETTSTDYPLYLSYDNSTDGLYNDVFISKINYGGAGLMFSTYFGGSGHDYGTSVAFDANRNVYVAGYTASSNFPTTSGAYDQTYNGNNSDVFILKFDAFGGTLVYSTLIGGSSTDVSTSIAVDASGNTYVTGYTASTTYPTTSDAYDLSYNGGDWDAFISKLNNSGSTLSYSTFIGGSSVDNGKSIAIDNIGNAYVTGYTTSGNYPTTSGAYDQSYNGNNSDVFVTKLSLSAPDIASIPLSGSYGSINIGSYSDITFVIRNEGNADLIVTATTMSSTEFSIQSGGDAYTMAPGATHDLVVRFSPASAGPKFASVNISSNDPDENPFQIMLSGNGVAVPDISVNTNAWSFGSVNIGSSQECTFIISNVGNADLNVNATTITGIVGVTGSEFVITSGDAPFTISAGATRNLVVRFVPNSIGNKTAQLSIGSNDPDENPFLIMLYANGTAAPKLLVNPISLDFGTTTTSLTFEISNTGGPTLNWTVAETQDKLWITSVTPASGSNNATITVTVDRNQLSVASDTGTLEVTSNGGNQNIIITISKIINTLPPTWNFTANTGNNTNIILPTTANPNIDGTPLQNGDYIGLFTPAGLCCGWNQWQGVNLSLIAWGDNDQTTAIDGFRANEIITYRVYRLSLPKEWATVAVGYTQGDGKYAVNSFMVLNKFNASDQRCLTLQFQNGWNMFSINVTPANQEIAAVMAPVVNNLIIAKKGNGKVYVPAYGINDIGSIQLEDGYQAYFNQAVSLDVCGQPVDPSTPINLPAGWSLISYLPNTQISAPTALASINSKLVIAKNGAGQTYIPAYSINDIGQMKPGQGYQVCLLGAATLIYPSTLLAKDAPLIAVPPVHFLCHKSTGENMTVVVPAVINPQYADGLSLELGDEIGVFIPAGHCCGAVVWNDANTAITVWGDDKQTSEVDGFTSDDMIQFRVWKKVTDKEFYARVAFQKDQSVVYQANEILVLKQLVAEFNMNADDDNSSILPIEFSLLQNYPNPFNATTCFDYTLAKKCEVTLKIFNLSGQEIATLVSGEQTTGQYQIRWTPLKLSSGVYLYRLQAGDFIATKKLIILQ